jgi:twitching motility protein PilT
MERFTANSMVLISGEHVLLQFDTGDRHATQSTTHDQIQALITEIAPPSVIDSLRRNESGSFEHRFEGRPYSVAVTPSTGKWKVVVAPAPDEPAQMVVERTSLSETAQEQPFAPLDPPSVSIRVADVRSDQSWIDLLLAQMKQQDCSDLHLTSGLKPYARRHGTLAALEGGEVLDSGFLLEQLTAIMPEKNRIQFDETNDTDFAYNLVGTSRFRVNMFMDRGGPGAVFRAIPFEIPDARKLGISDEMLDLCNLTKGLVLVTGPTGSGKSTTLAALIDHVNQIRTDHIITIEDPIEFVHPSKNCLVNQREVHTHTQSFKNALRAALREDPDIVLVGEMRDLETVEIAVETAETGHLVFGTLHTTTAPSTVDRIIDQFPADRQEQIRQMLSKSLRAVIAQVLCRRKGGGRVAAHEILFGTSAVENLIRERKTYQLFSVMQTSRNMGMKTMEDSLLELVKTGAVEPVEAYRKAINKTEFKAQLSRAGISV